MTTITALTDLQQMNLEIFRMVQNDTAAAKRRKRSTCSRLESDMASVVDLGKEKKFPITQELFDRLKEVVHEYDGDISLCEALGTLELPKADLIEGAN